MMLRNIKFSSVMLICLFMGSGLFSQGTAPDVTASPPVAPSDKDPAKHKNIVGVAESLKALMLPSDYAQRLKLTKFDTEPIFRIIKGKDEHSIFVYTCRFASAKSLLNAVEAILSAQGVVEQASEQNQLVINDRTDKMDELKDAVLSMDVSLPQVLVEAKVIEVVVSDSVQRDLSVVWNRTDTRQNLTSSMGGKTDVPDQATADKNKGADIDWFPVIAGGIGDSSYSNLQTTMQWLLTADDAKILSAPNVIVSRNSTASIVTGSDIPIQTIQVVSGSTTTSTDFKRIGVKLNVTPSLVNKDYVTLQVNPQVSNVLRYENIKQGDTNYPVPVISIRNIETQLTVRDGQVILLGGLYSSRDLSSVDKMPFFSDIPVLGDVFTGKNVSKEITQLLFILKVSILSYQEMAEGMIYDPGRQAEELRKAGSIIQDSMSIFPKNLDTIEDKIRGTISYEDASGNIDVIGKKKTPQEMSVDGSGSFGVNEINDPNSAVKP